MPTLAPVAREFQMPFSQADALAARNRVGLTRFAVEVAREQAMVMRGEMYTLASSNVLNADEIKAAQTDLEQALRAG